MIPDYLYAENLLDPALRAYSRNELRLRSYQAEALREIYLGVQRHRGEVFAVTFPRQSGKNETQAQLESAVMAANLWRGGTIVKILPTEKNQGAVSRKRLEGVLMSGGSGKTGGKIKTSKMKTVCGNTQVRYLSASPNTAIVGETADLMLEVDEAQLVPPEKFDRDAAPMAASTNATQVFWGTAWDDRTLLSRESHRALAAGSASGRKQFFLTDAGTVGSEVPAYADFVRKQVEALGREHPTVRTQFFCEEISDLTGMFTAERCEQMRGEHAPQTGPAEGHCYVFLIDIAGSDELSRKAKQSVGFSDRRDATVLTICDVAVPEGPDEGYDRAPVWRVAARRYYRNVPSDLLEKEISLEIGIWNPVRVALDHTGLGCMLTDYLSRKFPDICRAYDLTARAKTEMAWGFIAMVSTGRWQEYRCEETKLPAESLYDLKRDRCEILNDPNLLQRMFFRELRACRLDPAADPTLVRWGVPDGTRDPGTGRYIHDDLVMSAALAVFDEDDLPVYPSSTPQWPPEDLPDSYYESLEREKFWRRRGCFAQ